MLTISPVTKSQWVKVLKAAGYSFVSAFTFTLYTNNDYTKSGLYAAGIAAFNSALVIVKQLFTEG